MPRSIRATFALLALACATLPLAACGGDEPPRETAMASAESRPAGTFTAGPDADHHLATDSLVLRGDSATWHVAVWRRPTGSGPLVESRLACTLALEPLGDDAPGSRATARCIGDDPLAVEFAAAGNPYLLQFDAERDAWIIRAREGRGEAGVLPRRPGTGAPAAGPTVATASGSMGSRAPGVAPDTDGRVGTLCGDPRADCSASYWRFAPQDLGFRLPASWPDSGVVVSQAFYAVLVRSVPLDAAVGAEIRTGENCAAHPSEDARRALQARIPDRKVFASRIGCQDGPYEIGYTNVNPSYNFLAVYAGTTREEGAETLRRVQALGGYGDAGLRRMQAELTGDLRPALEPAASAP